jgi:hypothetical protein
VDLYIHSPIRLHGVMLNQLSTGTTLPFFYYVQFNLAKGYALYTSPVVHQTVSVHLYVTADGYTPESGLCGTY